MKIKQSIQITSNVTDIMKIPCVSSCRKADDGTLEFIARVGRGNYLVIARENDELLECEDDEGIVYWMASCADEHANETVKFSAMLTTLLCNKADEKDWSGNDVWKVTELFLKHSVVMIAVDKIIPKEELRRRMEWNLHELLDEAFKEVEELERRKQDEEDKL